MATKIKAINNPKDFKTVFINEHENKNVDAAFKNTFENTFLTSCFKYYYGKIKFINKTQEQLLDYSKSFIDVKKANSIIIIDYANIIWMLHYKYKNKLTIIKKFYTFIYEQLQKNSYIYIISKFVVIENINYDVDIVFNLGKKLTKKNIDPSYFTNEQICIYNFGYNISVDSSIDDLISYFLCFVLFVYLLNNNIDPAALKSSNSFKKLLLITNDKQFFDKNLFGKTDNEIKKVNIKNLFFKKLMITNETNENHRNNFYFKENIFEEELIKFFLRENDIANIHDTENLECNISVLLELLLKQKKQNKIKDINGYFMNHNKFPKYNPNFTKKHFTRKNIPNFSYNNLNNIQKKNTKKLHFKSCNLTKIKHKNNIIDYYYLYTFIKYIQLYSNTLTYENEEYGDFFGNLTKEQIYELF